jgi:clan AA aspartic protease
VVVGIVRESFILKNASLPHFVVLETLAMIDTGCTSMCIPESVRAQLDLEVLDTRPVFFADGSYRNVPYVGPIEIRFRERVACCGALVMGDEVLLGAVPLEEMDLVVVPKTQTLEYNPKGVRV